MRKQYLCIILVLAGCTGGPRDPRWDYHFNLLYGKSKAALEPAPAFTMLRLTNMPGDEIAAYFLDNSNIVFCHAAFGTPGLTMYRTATAGGSKHELADLRERLISAPLLPDPTGQTVAYTQVRETLIDLSEVSLLQGLPPGIERSDRFVAIASDVMIRDVRTGKDRHLTLDAHSEAVRWLAPDTLLVVVRGSSRGAVVTVPRKVQLDFEGRTYLGMSHGPALILEPILYRIYEVSETELIAEYRYPSSTNVLNGSLNPIPLSCTSRTRLVNLLKTQPPWLFPDVYGPFYFVGQDSALYRIVSWDEKHLVLMRPYRWGKGELDRFDMIVAELPAGRWLTVLAGLRIEWPSAVVVGDGHILGADTCGRISLTGFDGSKQEFARISGATYIRNLAASPDRKKFVVSALVSRSSNGYDLYLFSAKAQLRGEK